MRLRARPWWRECGMLGHAPLRPPSGVCAHCVAEYRDPYKPWPPLGWIPEQVSSILYPNRVGVIRCLRSRA